jgi:glycosyltransferase involved in cell wall biosynthesis
MIRVNFVMEQHVGLLTYYRNLRAYVETDSRIIPHWIDVTYRLAAPNSGWRQLPFLSDHVKGSIIGMQQTRRGIKQKAADATFFFTQVAALMAGSLRNRSPYVLCTDVTPIQYDQLAAHYNHQPDKPGLLSAYKHRQNVKVFQGASRILTWSNWARRSFIEDYGVRENVLQVIPIGVDLDLWCPAWPNKREKPVRILFVGGEFKRKGGDLLLQAFRQLAPETAELVLVTRSPVAAVEGVTVYHNLQPNSPELVALFKSCDIFVLPTQADTFGIVAVEAAATGLPVLMTDVGGVRDVVIDGETGFLLPAGGDVQALIERLRYLVEHAGVRRRMGQAARAHVEAHFDAQKNGKKVADILLEVAAGRWKKGAQS